MGALVSHLLLLTTLLSQVTSERQVGALKVSVSIPELVKLNDGFWLNCSHRHQHRRPRAHIGGVVKSTSADSQTNRGPSNEEIYAIKWYKDEEEFYRFLPNAEPRVSIYETNGIQLDQTKSHDGNVFLSKADVNSEGNYRCEILSEAPVFETVRKSKHLKVYALPVRGPRIEILDSNGRPKSPKAQEISYAVGDKIELRCNSAPSKPAARLRWYLNDHELSIPNSSNNVTASERQGRNSQTFGYDVKVTPIEYRQHYKGIFSSHSTLSLVLQQDDLINSKISFKCLASMRQDIVIQSKQLIVLTPDEAGPSPAGRLRARRFSSDLATTLGMVESEPHVQHRQRSQHHRHGISRLPQSSSSSASLSTRSQIQPKSSDLISSSLSDDLKNQFLYIYEDSDSTLGPSIIDTPDSLDSYLRRDTNVLENYHYQNPANSNNYALEFNRADNSEYVQLLRERMSHQRSLPGHQQNSGSHSLKRPHGTSSLVKSPLYLDEYDPLRPIIGWPPLESGKLMLLPPGNTIVAIPTQPSNDRGSVEDEQRFVLPANSNSFAFSEPYSSRNSFSSLIEDNDQSKIRQLMLERLIQNLNCTSTDGSIDSKLGWVVGDVPLNGRDVRVYPTRVSSDHRPMSTIGLQTVASQASSTSLQSVLLKYYRSPESPNQSRSAATPRSDSKANTHATNLQVAENNQIRFSCQANHPMLLYSSSEMITFDFNPPPNSPVDNSIDKMSPMSSNVIQASSASQSSSAVGWSSAIVSPGSQFIVALLITISFIASCHLEKCKMQH